MLSRIAFAVVALAMGPNPQSQFNPDWAVILSADEWRRAIPQCSREVPGPVGGTWTPDQDAIRRLDAALAPALQEALNHEQPDKSRRQAASGYYRQYFGLIVEGRRIVYVNGFHETYIKLALKDYWRDKGVNVCDGWTLFFGAEYDPVSGRIENIRFNGRAGG